MISYLAGQFLNDIAIAESERDNLLCVWPNYLSPTT